VILEQVSNGVAVRMAVLYLLAGQDADDEQTVGQRAEGLGIGQR
jgi:hypothetical protein